MKQLKSALALVLALVMVLALGGCTLNKGTTWIAKSGDVTAPSGVYILNPFQQLFFCGFGAAADVYGECGVGECQKPLEKQSGRKISE